MNKKNCVIVAGGKNSLHKIYTDCKRNYEVVLLAYEDCESHGAVYVRKDGFKYGLIHEYLKEKEFIYDKYLFIDDDILMSSEEIEELFRIAERYGSKIFHPAMNPKNFGHAPNMFKLEHSLIHTQNWTEITCLGMTKETLNELFYTFTMTKSGWGLPDIWAHLGFTFDIIDTVEAVHTKPMNTGEFYTKQGGIESAYKEWEEIVKKYPQKEFRITKKVPLKPILSIPIMYSEKDKKYKKDCLSTLPSYAQRIIVETINLDKAMIYDEEGLPPKEYVINWVWRGQDKIGKMCYKGDFNFGKARNEMLKLCDGEWIFSLDMDERLLVHQHTALLQWLENRDLHKGVGGYYVTNASVVTALPSPVGQCLRIVVPMCRLFRNEEGICYEEGVHEVPDRMIEKKGYKMIDSTLWIHHIGYEITKEELEQKCLRNIDGLSNPALKGKPEKLDYLINTVDLLQKIRGGL